MMKSIILRKLSLWRIQPRAATAAVAPLPAATTQFHQELAGELNSLQSLSIRGELGLAQSLDSAINTQKIALKSLVKIPYRGDVDRRALEEYLESNVDALDACNYFVDRIEDMKKYVNTLRVVARLVDDGGVNVNKYDAMKTERALNLLESCNGIEKKCKKSGLCLRRMLRQKLFYDHHGTEFCEIVSGSKAMALMGCRFLELGLSFDSKKGFPLIKKCHPMCSFLLDLAEEAKGSAEKKLHKMGYGSLVIGELQQTVAAARELKEQMKGKRENEMVKPVVERLKRSCRGLEDELGFLEGRVKDLYKGLVDVRMALLGILSQA